jgi:hypothetical protein
MDFKEMGWAGVDSIHLTQDKEPLVVSCEHSNVSSGSIKCWVFLEYVSKYQLLK